VAEEGVVGVEVAVLPLRVGEVAVLPLREAEQAGAGEASVAG